MEFDDRRVKLALILRHIAAKPLKQKIAATIDCGVLRTKEDRFGGTHIDLDAVAQELIDAAQSRGSVTADPRVAVLEEALEEAHRAGVSVLMGAGPHSEGRMSIMETWRVRELGVAMQKLHTLLATSNVQPATPQPSGEVA